MSGTLAKIDYQTLAEIAARVVLAVEQGDPAAAAAKIARAMQSVTKELTVEGRLVAPTSHVSTPPQTSSPRPEESTTPKAPVREHEPVDTDSYKLADPVRERLRKKAQAALEAARHLELHPKVAASTPAPSVALLLEAHECIQNDKLFCMLDGEVVTDLSYHVRAKYGLTWDEYLKLTGLSAHFPRTRFTIRKSQTRMAAQDRADVTRKKQEEKRAAKASRRSAVVKAKAAPPQAKPAPPAKIQPARATPAPPAKIQPARATPAPPASSAPKKPAAKPSKDRSSPTIIMSIEDSVTDDLIYCLFDRVGRRMITRHIRQKWGMSWEQYLSYCNLPSDYPRVAKNYSDRHSLKMSKVMNTKSIDESSRRQKREKALEVKKRHVLETPTRGLVDGAVPPAFNRNVRSPHLH